MAGVAKEISTAGMARTLIPSIAIVRSGFIVSLAQLSIVLHKNETDAFSGGNKVRGFIDTVNRPYLWQSQANRDCRQIYFGGKESIKFAIMSALAPPGWNARLASQRLCLGVKFL
jgi:hypothetical protein